MKDLGNIHRTKILFDRQTIANRVAELGKKISEDYAGKSIVAIGVMKGSVIFFSDLVRHISRPVEFEFVGVKSYEGSVSTGHVQITSDVSMDIKDRHVLLVEDIVDTGMTIDFLTKLLKVRQPASLRICALLSKPDAHIMSHQLDYVGFEIAKEFVVGYGLDLDGGFRNLDHIVQIV